MALTCKYSWHVMITSFWTFYIVCGLSTISFIIALDIIIKNDYKYTGDYTQEQRKKNNSEFTSVKLPWSSQFPMLLLTIFLSSVFVFTILSYRLLIIWIERLFFPDDLNRVFANNQGVEESEDEEIEIKSYKFKAPGLIKRITSTYFTKSKEEDMQKIKRKLSKLMKKYKKQDSKRSIDLENIMRDRDFEAERNRTVSRFEETKVNNITQLSYIGKYYLI